MKLSDSDLFLEPGDQIFLAELGGFVEPFERRTRNQHLENYWQAKRFAAHCRRTEIFHEHLLEGTSLRQLAKKYNVSHETAAKDFRKAMARHVNFTKCVRRGLRTLIEQEKALQSRRQ